MGEDSIQYAQHHHDTYRVAGLLRKDLGELDHSRIIVETFRKVNHAVCGILLLARTGRSEKGGKGGD